MKFRNKVYLEVGKIPKGKVATYKQIASLAGNPKASRAVGMYMKTNPFAPKVPCHRVVKSDGRLGGFSMGEGPKTKQNLLIKEGITFSGNKINLSLFQWNKR